MVTKYRIAVLKWKKYPSYKKARDDDYCQSEGKTSSKGKGIYLMADNKGIPLYIGMVYGKWGFADRYNAWGFLDAAIEAAGNLIFFAQVDSKSLCRQIETQLVWEESKHNRMISRYNETRTKPQGNITIRHKGEVPNFRFMCVQRKETIERTPKG